MKSTQLSLRHAAGAALLLLAGGCSSAPSAQVAASSASLWPAIAAEVGDAACDAAAQCHSIGVGHKPCGGPGGYLAWSSKTSDEARLKAMVERHAAAQREEQQRSGMLSNCQYLPDPGASCVASHCRLNKAGPSPSLQ